MQHRLLVEAGLTLDKAFEMAQGMEAAAVDAKQFHTKTANTETDGTNVRKINTNSQRKPSQTACYRCLGTGYSPEICRFKSFRCNKCHKLGHIARACMSESSQSRPNYRGQGNRALRRRPPNKAHMVENAGESESELDVLHIHAVGVSIPKSYKQSQK